MWTDILQSCPVLQVEIDSCRRGGTSLLLPFLTHIHTTSHSVFRVRFASSCKSRRKIFHWRSKAKPQGWRYDLRLGIRDRSWAVEWRLFLSLAHTLLAERGPPDLPLEHHHCAPGQRSLLPYRSQKYSSTSAFQKSSKAVGLSNLYSAHTHSGEVHTICSSWMALPFPVS